MFDQQDIELHMGTRKIRRDEIYKAALSSTQPVFCSVILCFNTKSRIKYFNIQMVKPLKVLAEKV